MLTYTIERPLANKYPTCNSATLRRVADDLASGYTATLQIQACKLEVKANRKQEQANASQADVNAIRYEATIRQALEEQVARC